MTKGKKKSAKEASNTFHNIMKASVKDNPKPKNSTMNYYKMTCYLKNKSDKEITSRNFYCKDENEITPEDVRDRLKEHVKEFYPNYEVSDLTNWSKIEESKFNNIPNLIIR